MVDVYRLKYPDNDGYTTSLMERLDYILFYIADLKNNHSPYNNELNNIKNEEEFLKLLFKAYDVYFLDFNINKTINISTNYPVESLMIIKNSQKTTSMQKSRTKASFSNLSKLF